MHVHAAGRTAPSTLPATHARPSVTACLVLLVMMLGVHAGQPRASARSSAGDSNDTAPSIERAQRFFYNSDYDQASAMSRALCTARPDDLDACELRTASLHFQIKKAVADTGEKDKEKAWARCGGCPALMTAFLADIARAQTFARARLTARPDDKDLLFFLGKVDLNYVWLRAGTLGQKTGWDEYWEGRKSLDHVLRIDPGHVRARVARAWMDYTVGTTVPRGVRWLLGGGNKKRGLLTVREVADSGGGAFFARIEVLFALWEMQVREKQFPAAVVTAKTLAKDFPENRELRKFLAVHDPAALAIPAAASTP